MTSAVSGLVVAATCILGCGEDSLASSTSIAVCGRGDRQRLASELEGGTLSLTFRSADGRVLRVRDAAADRPESLALDLPAGTASVDVEALDTAGRTVASGTGALVDDRACVCLARDEEYQAVCAEVACELIDDGDRCRFYDPRQPPPCGTVAASGETIIDNDSSCMETGGTASYLREVNDDGYGGDLIWTHTTAESIIDNFARWNLHFERGGSYRIEAYTAAGYAESVQSRYIAVHGSWRSEVVVDQTAVDGWNPVAELEFDAGGVQSVWLPDNTGEPGEEQIRLVFDALRLTPVP